MFVKQSDHDFVDSKLYFQIVKKLRKSGVYSFKRVPGNIQIRVYFGIQFGPPTWSTNLVAKEVWFGLVHSVETPQSTVLVELSIFRLFWHPNMLSESKTVKML